MKSISGNKDTDRLILLGLSDRDLLQTCGINSYFRNEVCNDNFFLERLLKTYPDTVQKIDTGYGALYGPAKSWKQYYLDMIYWISKLKETYKFEYKGGNPKKIYLEEYIRMGGNLEELFHSAIKEEKKDIAKLILETENVVIRQSLKDVIRKGYYDILELLIKKLDKRSDIRSVLIDLINHGNISFVNYFIEKEYFNLEDLNFALHYLAAYNTNKNIAKFLIKKGADIEKAKKIVKTHFYGSKKTKATEFLNSLKSK